MSEIDPHLFKSFSDAVPYGVCLVDLQGKIIYWNSAAERISGYLGAEVLGRAYRGDLLVQCGRKTGCTEVCPVADVLRDGKPITSDLFLRHKDGHRLPVRVSAFSLRDGTGEIKSAGEIFSATQIDYESRGWAGHSDREFEMATGLPAVEETREHLNSWLQSRAASSSALILIEMSEQSTMMQHGGTAMLHQAIRMLGKTMSGLLPALHYVGCWTDWRLIAIIPDCDPETLDEVKLKLATVGSSCAVKWWGDRVVVGIRAAACNVDSTKTVDALIQELEQNLKSTTDKEG